MLQCTSSLHAGTIRRLAADEKALVSAASDKRIRLFPATTPPTCSNSTTTTDWYYDITITDSRRLVSGTLRGHTGPITALALTPTTIISGSWDYTIKVWDRKDLSNPIQSITLDDWVVDCTLVCNKRLLHVVTTTSVLSFAITGVGCIASPVPLFKVLDCSVTTMGCVAATEDGGWLMYGGGGGESGGAVVVAVDLKRRRKKMVLATSLSLSQQQQRQQQSVVTCMHWEYPQLAVGTSSGDLVLLDLEKLIQTNTDSKSSNSANSASGLPYEGADAMVASQDTISITSTEKIPSGIYMGLGPNIMVPHRKIPTTMATVGTTTSGGGVVVGGGGGPQSSSSSYNNVSSRYAFTTTAATLEQQHSILQSVDRYNGWLVAGFGNGSILTWDGRSALERQHVADKARVARRNARLAKKIDSGKGKGKGKKGGGGYKGEEEKSSVQRVMNELEQGEKKEEEEEDEGEVDDVDIEVGNCMTDSDDHDNEVTRSSLFPLLSTTPTINDDDDDDALVGGSSRRKKPSLIVPGPITATNGGGVGGVGTNVLSRGGESCRQEAWHVLKRRPASVTVPPPP
jgi:WD40 repeat protein